MEKYRYYDKIRDQIYIIDKLYLRGKSGDFKLKSDINEHLLGSIFRRLSVYYDNRYDTIVINFDYKYHKIKVDDKYKQDMLNLFEHR